VNTRDVLRTHYSIQATEIAASFNAALSKLRLQPGDYSPELTAPEGQSTAGGKLAMQRLRLVPNQPGYPTFVFGNANHKEGTAEIRTYDYLDAQNRERFKRPLMLDRAQYDQLLEMTKNILGVMRLRVTLVNASSFTAGEETLDVSRDAKRARARDGESARGPSPMVKLVIGIAFFALALLVLGAIGVWLFVIKR
jgi:hypothetical protein